MSDPETADATKPRKKRSRKAGASSTVNVDAPTAERIDELVAHFSKETGFAIERAAIVERAVTDLWYEAMPKGDA